MLSLSKDLVSALKNIVFDCSWQNVGREEDFESFRCYRLYSYDDIEEDILLVKDKNGRFHAIEAICSHEGGPLDQGDIEELGSKLLVICPWHSFDFDLRTGLSSTGLKQQTFETKVVDGHVYVNSAAELSLKSRPSEITSPVKDAPVSEATIPEEANTLAYWAAKILNTASPREKCELTRLVGEKWRSGEVLAVGKCQAPDTPGREGSLNVLEPAKIKRGKGGTLASRVALIHSLANIEQWAIDLSWDVICRFSSLEYPDKTVLPKAFFDDFVQVACDEAKHFILLEKRLVELGSSFGSLPVHNGLWESADTTKDNFLARLAIVHMVHEARGLDVHPQTRERFAKQNDQESVELLDVLYKDEITHVAAGIRWFEYSCQKYDYECLSTFHTMVKKYFKGYLKPPFNTAGRISAGMEEKWYMPLIKPS